MESLNGPMDQAKGRPVRWGPSGAFPPIEPIEAHNIDLYACIVRVYVWPLNPRPILVIFCYNPLLPVAPPCTNTWSLCRQLEGQEYGDPTTIPSMRKYAFASQIDCYLDNPRKVFSGIISPSNRHASPNMIVRFEIRVPIPYMPYLTLI